MKLFKLFAMLACMGAMFCVTGCGSNTPEAVVKDFLNTVQAGKLDQAYLESHLAGFTEEMANLKKKLGSDQKKVDAQVKEFVEMLNEGAKKHGKDAKFSIVESKIDGDKATVTVKFVKDGKEETEKIPVKKINDKWMISIK